MIEVNSFAELRTTVPAKQGDVATLKRYYAGDNTFRGGGEFVAFTFTGNSPYPDNGGTVAVGTNYFWRRTINDPALINVLHFGARANGTTDDNDAVMRYLNWARTWNTEVNGLPIRFPAGKYLISPIDTSATEFGFFGLYGDDVELGAVPRTTIISTKSDQPVFKIKARRTAIRGIAWNGQASADINTNTAAIAASMCTNAQPFLENIITQGQSTNVTCFKAQNAGGTVFKLIDTFDSKFDQIYTGNTFGRVFDVGWSDSPGGGWNHSTAIEITNSNFQSGYGDATLYMPRMTQGLISNVWIERTRYPGNLSEGQWKIQVFNLEGCSNPLNLDNSRVLMSQINLQAGAKLSTAMSSPRWLSGYEYGWRRDENFGTQLTGSLRVGHFSGYRLNNSTDTDNWYRVGAFNFPIANQQWVAEFIGRASTADPSGTAGSPTATVSTGITEINLQRGSSVWVDMFHRGSPAIIDARYNRQGVDFVELWVKLKAGSGDTMFNLKTTGPTRFDAGVCSQFSPDFSLITDLTKLGPTKPQMRFALHNGLAGIGANEKGVLTLATAVAAKPVNATTPGGYITVNINGVDHKLAYYD